MIPLPLVLATGNADKAREILEVFTDVCGVALAAVALAPTGFLVDVPERVAESVTGLRPLPDDLVVEETGATLLDNARIKARALRDATGVAALADDTGLEVDALGGAPGVRSARYAGAQASYGANVARLLAALAGVESAADRTARFATVVVVALADGRELVARGVCDGSIAAEAQGEGGFGYDPVFVPVDGDGRSFAQMSAGEKHARSHRGRAVRELARALAEEV